MIDNDTPQTPSLITSFKSFYRDLNQMRLDDMGALYDSEVVFRDPVHELRGINNVHAYMSSVCRNIREGRFEYLDELVGDGSAYIKWHMYFSHHKLGCKTICVRGVSHIEFKDKIVFHEDVYDMGEMLYEHLPVLGRATQWLKSRLANGVK